MFAVAVLSWRFVEQPFRSGALKLPRRQLFIAAAVATTVIACMSIWGIASKGIPSRFTPSELALARYATNGKFDAQWGRGCFASEGHPIERHCLTMSAGQPNYLLFGDSHAAHLWLGLYTILPDIHLLQATGANCKPLLASLKSPDPSCRQLAGTMFNDFFPSHHVDAVILSCIWTRNDFSSLAETVARFRGMGQKVYVVGPIFMYDQPLPYLLIKARRSGDSTFVDRHAMQSQAAYKDFDDELAAAALGDGAARYISLNKLLCTSQGCLEYVDSAVPLQFDGAHLSNEGSVHVAKLLRDSGQLP
jgi:hypothetical protein